MNTHIGKPVTIEVNGKLYTFGRLTREVGRAFTSWAIAQLPNPLDVIADKLSKFPEKYQDLMVKEAMKKARMQCDFTSEEVQNLTHTWDGMLYLNKLLLQQNHTTITDDEVFAVVTALGEREQAKRLAVTIKKEHPDWTAEQVESEVKSLTDTDDFPNGSHEG